MKHVLLLSTLFFASMVIARPIASLKYAKGYCPGQCAEPAILIEDSGVVWLEVTHYEPTPSVERRIFLTLNKDIANAIKRNIRSIKASALMDLDENKPPCVDTPELIYSIVKNSEPIEIGRDRQCHQYRLQDFSGNWIADLLRSLLSRYYETLR